MQLQLQGTTIGKVEDIWVHVGRVPSHLPDGKVELSSWKKVLSQLRFENSVHKCVCARTCVVEPRLN